MDVLNFIVSALGQVLDILVYVFNHAAWIFPVLLGSIVLSLLVYRLIIPAIGGSK